MTKARADRLALSLTGVVAALVLSACGSDSAGTKSADNASADNEKAATESEAGPDPESVSVTPNGVTCAGNATAAPTPYSDKAPADLPLPPDTVIYGVDDRGDTGVVLTGVSASPLDTVREYFNTRWPQAGYTLLEGETEELDAESNWDSTDYTGRWAIQDISADCPGETGIQVLSTPK